MQDTFKKGFGDRYDGWRVRHVDAVYNVIPFVMRTRLDAQNLFEENIPIENIERFIRDHREDIGFHATNDHGFLQYARSS